MKEGGKKTSSFFVFWFKEKGGEWISFKEKMAVLRKKGVENSVTLARIFCRF